MSTKTKKSKVDTYIKHDWYVVDATGKVLGRLASTIASLLRGKNRVDFTPYENKGAGVVVLHCDKVRLTGKKSTMKNYRSFSGYPGGYKEISCEKMLVKDPKYVLRHAVEGMLPKNRLSVKLLRRLKLYVGDKHPHMAQAPKELKIKIRGIND